MSERYTIMVSAAVLYAASVVQAAPLSPAAKCQEALATGARKFETTLLRSLALCHARRMAGSPDYPATMNCNMASSLPLSMLNGLLRSESGWQRRVMSRCSEAGSPSALGYQQCPAPCEAISVDAGYASLVSCLACLARAEGSAGTEAVFGAYPDPPVVPGQASLRSCQSALGRALREVFSVRLAEQIHCQKAVAGGAVPGGTDCETADLRGRVARKLAAVDKFVRKRCPDSVLASLTSCGGNQDLVIACNAGHAGQMAGRLFGAVYFPQGRTPTPTRTSTPTATVTFTSSATPTATETPSPTMTSTATETPTVTASPTETPTASPTHTWPPAVPTYTPTPSPTETVSPTVTATPQAIVKTCSFGGPGTRLGLQWDKLIFTQPLGRTVCPMSGSFDVSVGPQEAQGLRSVTIPAASVVFDPVVCNVAGVQTVTICVESPGADGWGTLDCDGGTPNYDFWLEVDHNTNAAPQSNGGFVADASCTATYTDPLTGETWLACMEQSGGTCNLNNLHPGVCNSPYHPSYPGTFPAGGMTVRLPLRLKNVAQASGNPCDGVGDTYNVTTEFTAFLTTGTARGTVYDANNTNRKIDEGAACYGGTCVTRVTGAPVTAFCADPQASLAGVKMVTALTVLDLHSLGGDTAATVEVQCQ
ncbi:MAG: hypothetical protein KatS3mg077_0797 [Candidatus Binatia bacterium]|nr:MAG: hypothetical protein KatS3mg077_0797 [Candidatus Binatia bacterium]